MTPNVLPWQEVQGRLVGADAEAARLGEAYALLGNETARARTAAAQCRSPPPAAPVASAGGRWRMAEGRGLGERDGCHWYDSDDDKQKLG